MKESESEPTGPTVEQLLNALKKYGDHHMDCRIYTDTGRYQRMAGERCSCGWKLTKTALIDRFERPEPPKAA